MIVLTVDQQGSRRVGDRVEELLGFLGGTLTALGAEPVRPFERTVGDEVQAVLDDPDTAVRLALAILRHGGWSVGIGAGAVEEPLAASSRAGAGEAFVLARRAVERAKSRARPVPMAVEGARGDRARDCEAVLTLLAAVRDRRTDSGWAVVDLIEELGARATQELLAHRLGITQQAVSQRLRTALWAEELAGRPVAARLLAEAAR
jgi:hypothetical protein